MSDTSPLARVEAFSDGIFAIAATLLVLEIRVPALGADAQPGELVRQLANLWPSYLAFVISFGSILVAWVNHHNAIRMLQRSSKVFLYANGFLLMAITFIPFPTAVLARYIDTRFAAVATTFYAGYSLLTSIAFSLWVVAMDHPAHLLKPAITRAHYTKLRNQTLGGLLVYLFTVIVSWRFPVVGLLVISVLWILWALMSIGAASEQCC